MNNPFSVGILLLLILGVFMGVAITPAAADAMMNINEFRITTDTAEQSNPDIDGIHIVYMDNRNGNWDIYLYTLQGTFVPETQITTNILNQQNPAIYGNHIVYMDDRNGNWDIYLYDIGTRTETRITNNTANQMNPAIHGNRIVWQDNRDGHYEVYMYDLATQAESRITTSVASQNPAIYGNRIVYKKTTLFNGRLYDDVCMFDFATWRETTFSASLDYISSSEPHPAIYGDYIAFASQHENYPWAPYDSNIVLKNVNKDPWVDEWKTTSTAEQTRPDIYWESSALGYLVWQDNRNGNWDINVYNLDRKTETLVTNNSAGQQNPAVYGGRIVYQDDRNGNWDIYMAMLSYSQYPDTPTPTPTPATTPRPTQAPGGSIGHGSKANTGSLYVASYPSGAAILIDGTNRGETSQLINNVAAGNRNLTLIKQGYQPYTTEVTVPAGDVKALAPIILTKGDGGESTGTGAIYIRAYPTNATIYIDGIDRGTPNRFVYNVPAGNRNLTLVRDGYRPYTQMVMITEGDMKVLGLITLTPVKPPGSFCPPWQCEECHLNFCACVPC